MDAWLNQILGYLLVDRHDVLLADRIGLYLGWQGLLLTIPVPDLLAGASRGPTPELAAVREDCAEALAEDVENAASWRLREWYPTPLS